MDKVGGTVRAMVPKRVCIKLCGTRLAERSRPGKIRKRCLISRRIRDVGNKGIYEPMVIRLRVCKRCILAGRNPNNPLCYYAPPNKITLITQFTFFYTFTYLV